MSGLNGFLEDFLHSKDIPETVKNRIKARMLTYSGNKEKQVAINEMRIGMFGDQRWAIILTL